jgi:hypothetical protein
MPATILALQFTWETSMPTEPMTATTPLPTGASTTENDTLSGSMTSDRIDLQGGDDIFLALGGY